MMGAGAFEGRYVWHPAADDHQLAQACVDVQAGLCHSALAVLQDTQRDFGVRAHRSLVLAAVLLIATVWWFTTARRRFKGPVSYGSPDEVAAMDLI